MKKHKNYLEDVITLDSFDVTPLRNSIKNNSIRTGCNTTNITMLVNS